MNLRAAAAFLFAFPLAAQQEPPAEPLFAESIDVEVVNVEVYVTDGAGSPVRGLTRRDFQLLVDGRPVEIVNFFAVAEGAPVAVETPPAASPAGGAGAPVETAPPAPEPPPLSLVVYVDNDNLRPFGRNRVLRQLRTFLDATVGPQDRVMVVTHDQGVNVRRPLSVGKETLAAELARLEKLAARGVLQDSSARRTLDLVRDLGCERADEAAQAVRGYALAVANEAKISLNALESLVESFSGLAGRKVVLYVSDGLPLHPGEEAFRFLHELCGGQDPFSKTENLAGRFRALTRLANANGVTFYTLEASGARSFSSASAAEAPLGLTATATVNLDLEKTGDAQQVLFNLASETGGRAALNGNDIQPDLARIAGDLRSYYSLGYTPERAGKDRVHSLTVRTEGKGLRVRSRTTYTDRPREERLAARVQTALLHGIVENPLQARLELVSSQPAGRGRQRVTLRLQLPLKQLVLLSRGNVWAGQVTLWLAARDADGRTTPVQSVRVPVRIPALEGKAQLDRTFAYELRLQMAERGEQTVAVGIQDDLGHTTSFVRASFRVNRKGAVALGPER